MKQKETISDTRARLRAALDELERVVTAPQSDVTISGAPQFDWGAAAISGLNVMTHILALGHEQALDAAFDAAAGKGVEAQYEAILDAGYEALLDVGYKVANDKP